MPFTCITCGKTREQEQDQEGKITEGSLRTQECSSCRHYQNCNIEEQWRIQNALITGRIPRGTQYLVDEIEAELDSVTNENVRERLSQAIMQIRVNEAWEESEANSEEEEEVKEFTVTGIYNKPIDIGPCPVCRDPDAKQRYISHDQRITACEQCAREWTDYSRTTLWLEIKPKEEVIKIAGNSKNE
jgi:hypothetical protein